MKFNPQIENSTWLLTNDSDLNHFGKINQGPNSLQLRSCNPSYSEKALFYLWMCKDYTTPRRFKNITRASLVVQWLRVRLPIQGTRVRALVWEDPACRRATGPVSHNYWACASGACAPQQERPRWWEVHAPRWRVAPACRNWREPWHRDEDPTQPKIN